jgi:hypothetical protein
MRQRHSSRGDRSAFLKDAVLTYLINFRRARPCKCMWPQARKYHRGCPHCRGRPPDQRPLGGNDDYDDFNADDGENGQTAEHDDHPGTDNLDGMHGIEPNANAGSNARTTSGNIGPTAGLLAPFATGAGSQSVLNLLIPDDPMLVSTAIQKYR